MGTVLNLRIYRYGKLRGGPQNETERTWGCDVCGGSTWRLSTSSEIRCAGCGSVAENLAAVKTTDLTGRYGASDGHSAAH